MHDTRWKQAVEWLAAAATDPQECKRQWDHGHGTALLAAGRYWDVLSVPDRLGLLALDLLWSDPLELPGPTLVDVTARRVGFFLPPDPDSEWVGCGVRHVGRGSWIAVPPPYRPPGGWSGWSRRTARARCTRRNRWNGRCGGRPARWRCWRRSVRRLGGRAAGELRLGRLSGYGRLRLRRRGRGRLLRRLAW